MRMACAALVLMTACYSERAGAATLRAMPEPAGDMPRHVAVASPVTLQVIARWRWPDVRSVPAKGAAHDPMEALGMVSTLRLVRHVVPVPTATVGRPRPDPAEDLVGVGVVWFAMQMLVMIAAAHRDPAAGPSGPRLFRRALGRCFARNGSGRPCSRRGTRGFARRFTSRGSRAPRPRPIPTP